MRVQSNEEKYQGKNILSVDYGTKVIGLATYACGRDPFPLPYGRIIVQSDAHFTLEIQNIIQIEDIDLLVWGVPLLTDGTQTDQTLLTKRVGEELSKKIQIPLFFQDETLSTYEAKDRMKNSPQYNFKIDLKQLDALSASIILEDFLR